MIGGKTKANLDIQQNYPDTYRRYLALVGVKQNRLDISLMKNGALQSYRYVVTRSDQEIVDHLLHASRFVCGFGSRGRGDVSQQSNRILRRPGHLLLETIGGKVWVAEEYRSLRPEQLKQLKGVVPDYFAVRTSACAAGKRDGVIDATRVKRWKEMLAGVRV